jgi:hypothetical protein
MFLAAEYEDRELLLYYAVQFSVNLPTYTASHPRIL